MKRFCAGIALLVVLLFSINLAVAEETTLYGPETFLVARGMTYPAGEFPGTPGEAILIIDNGNPDGSARCKGAIYINGEEFLFFETDSHLEIPLNVAGNNSISYRFKGRSGSKVTIQIIQETEIQLSVFLDHTRSASATITDSGGSISTVAADGTEFLLTIPDGALFPQREITVTPIISIDGLPLEGGFLSGVDISPDGIHLLKAATLTITPPTTYDNNAYYPVGFAYYEEGSNYHLYPLVEQEAGTYKFQIFHFSGYGMGYASENDLDNAILNPPNGAEGLLQQIAAIIAASDVPSGGTFTPEEEAALRNLVQNYYDLFVLPYLEDVKECFAAGKCSVNMPNVYEAYMEMIAKPIKTYLKWLKLALQMGFDDLETPGMLSNVFEQYFMTYYQTLNQECANLAQSDYCAVREQIPSIEIGHVEVLLQMYKLGVQLGWMDDFQSASFCGGFLKRENEIEITPRSLTLNSGATQNFTATVKDHFGEEIPGATVKWELSPDDFSIILGAAEGPTTSANAIAHEGTVQLKATGICDIQDAVQIELLESCKGLVVEAAYENCEWASSKDDPDRVPAQCFVPTDKTVYYTVRAAYLDENCNVEILEGISISFTSPHAQGGTWVQGVTDSDGYFNTRRMFFHLDGSNLLSLIDVKATVYGMGEPASAWVRTRAMAKDICDDYHIPNGYPTSNKGGPYFNIDQIPAYGTAEAEATFDIDIGSVSVSGSANVFSDCYYIPSSDSYRGYDTSAMAHGSGGWGDRFLIIPDDFRDFDTLAGKPIITEISYETSAASDVETTGNNSWSHSDSAFWASGASIASVHPESPLSSPYDLRTAYLNDIDPPSANEVTYFADSAWAEWSSWEVGFGKVNYIADTYYFIISAQAYPDIVNNSCTAASGNASLNINRRTRISDILIFDDEKGEYVPYSNYSIFSCSGKFDMSR